MSVVLAGEAGVPVQVLRAVPGAGPGVPETAGPGAGGCAESGGLAVNERTKKYRAKGMKRTAVDLDPVLFKALKQKALDLNIAYTQLARDVLALYAGYAIPPDDPRYHAEFIGGDLPMIEERYPGYVERLDVFLKGPHGAA